MEYKTPMIAEMMGVSPKVVKRIVHQLKIELKKNNLGHYIFNEEDVQQIRDQYAAEQEAAAAVTVLEAAPEAAPPVRQEPLSENQPAALLGHIEGLQAQIDELRGTMITEAVSPLQLQHIEQQLEHLQDLLSSQRPAAASVPLPALQSEIGMLTKRADAYEEALRRKADEVVSYQVLQHRREMEEMQQRMQLLEERLERLEERKQVTALPNSTYTEKPKRRRAIFSIFGL